MKKKVAAKRIAKKGRATKKKLTVREAYDYYRRIVQTQALVVNRSLGTILTRLEAIEFKQREIARAVDLVMKDFIRHPLKIDGMNQAAFRDLVDRAARNDPNSFSPDWEAKSHRGIIDDG